MEILKLIRTDHGQVKTLFRQLEQRAEIPGEETEALVAKLVTEILLHAKAEEKALYRHCRQRTEKLREFALEGHVEHKLLEIAVKRLSVVPPGPDGKFKAVLKVAKELFLHHAIEEEEKEIFPKVMKAFSQEEREELGARMQEIKDELRAKKEGITFDAGEDALVRAEGTSEETSSPTVPLANPSPEGMIQAIRPEAPQSPGAAGAVPSRSPERVPAAVVPAPSAGISQETAQPGQAPLSEQLKPAV